MKKYSGSLQQGVACNWIAAYFMLIFSMFCAGKVLMLMCHDDSNANHDEGKKSPSKRGRNNNRKKKQTKQKRRKNIKYVTRNGDKEAKSENFAEERRNDYGLSDQGRNMKKSIKKSPFDFNKSKHPSACAVITNEPVSDVAGVIKSLERMISETADKVKALELTATASHKSRKELIEKINEFAKYDYKVVDYIALNAIIKNLGGDYVQEIYQKICVEKNFYDSITFNHIILVAGKCQLFDFADTVYNFAINNQIYDNYTFANYISLFLHRNQPNLDYMKLLSSFTLANSTGNCDDVVFNSYITVMGRLGDKYSLRYYSEQADNAFVEVTKRFPDKTYGYSEYVEILHYRLKSHYLRSTGDNINEVYGGKEKSVLFKYKSKVFGSNCKQDVKAVGLLFEKMETCLEKVKKISNPDSALCSILPLMIRSYGKHGKFQEAGVLFGNYKNKYPSGRLYKSYIELLLYAEKKSVNNSEIFSKQVFTLIDEAHHQNLMSPFAYSMLISACVNKINANRTPLFVERVYSLIEKYLLSSIHLFKSDPECKKITLNSRALFFNKTITCFFHASAFKLIDRFYQAAIHYGYDDVLTHSIYLNIARKVDCHIDVMKTVFNAAKVKLNLDDLRKVKYRTRAIRSELYRCSQLYTNYILALGGHGKAHRALKIFHKAVKCNLLDKEMLASIIKVLGRNDKYDQARNIYNEYSSGGDSDFLIDGVVKSQYVDACYLAGKIYEAKSIMQSAAKLKLGSCYSKIGSGRVYKIDLHGHGFCESLLVLHYSLLHINNISRGGFSVRVIFGKNNDYGVLSLACQMYLDANSKHIRTDITEKQLRGRAGSLFVRMYQFEFLKLPYVNKIPEPWAKYNAKRNLELKQKIEASIYMLQPKSDSIRLKNFDIPVQEQGAAENQLDENARLFSVAALCPDVRKSYSSDIPNSSPDFVYREKDFPALKL